MISNFSHSSIIIEELVAAVDIDSCKLTVVTIRSAYVWSFVVEALNLRSDLEFGENETIGNDEVIKIKPPTVEVVDAAALF
jgi:hypothetical protein